jgi:phospholipase C
LTPLRVFVLATVAALVGLSTGCARIDDAAASRRTIRHVVIVIQENRSFDNLFHGFPGADSANSGLTHLGRRVPLKPISLTVDYDISHGYRDFINDYDGGKMDGFDREHVGAGRGRPAPVIRTQYPQYGYVPTEEIRPYWWLAQRYVVSDRMFQSNLDQSFAAHLILIAAQSGGAVNVPNGRPWGCDAPAWTRVRTLTSKRENGWRVFPCFTMRTLADELDEKGLGWRYYAPAVDSRAVWLRYLKKRRQHRLHVGERKPDFGQLWSAYDAIAPIRYGADWTRNVISPETSVFSDLRDGELAAVTWIVPDMKNSDHSISRSSTGPDWVAAIVNEIGHSRFWSDTAIFVVWDDSGGWYDHVPPPQLDYDGLGDRVPLLTISPYAKKGHVSHVQTEFGSILKFAETVFGLNSLSASDARANDLFDAFDFSAPPRRFETVPSRFGPADFLRSPPSLVAPDDD